MTSSVAYHAIAPAVSSNPGFHPLCDFTHVAYIGGPPNVLVVNPALNVHSLAELVALGRRGAAIDYVSPGVGTLGHLVAEVFAQKAGIKIMFPTLVFIFPGIFLIILGPAVIQLMVMFSKMDK